MIMRLTDGENRIISAIASIGAANTSMQDVADSLNLSYWYLMQKRCEIARKNGYNTFLGFLCDYVAEKTRREMEEG